MASRALLDLLVPGAVVALLGAEGAGKTVVALQVALAAATLKPTTYVLTEPQERTKDFLRRHPHLTVADEPTESTQGFLVVDSMNAYAAGAYGGVSWRAVPAALAALKRAARASGAAVLAVVTADPPASGAGRARTLFTESLTVADAGALVKPADGWTRQRADGHFVAGPGELLVLKPYRRCYTVSNVDMSAYEARYIAASFKRV